MKKPKNYKIGKCICGCGCELIITPWEKDIMVDIKVPKDSRFNKRYRYIGVVLNYKKFKNGLKKISREK